MLLRSRADLPDFVDPDPFELPDPECDELADPFELAELRRDRCFDEDSREEDRFDGRFERDLCDDRQLLSFERQLLSGDVTERSEEYVELVSSLPRGVVALSSNSTAECRCSQTSCSAIRLSITSV